MGDQGRDREAVVKKTGDTGEVGRAGPGQSGRARMKRDHAQPDQLYEM